ncbi:MAG: GAF domain-containing protein, partial [Alphaproteobacteria bacterium]|nr:GAF domain-containing protein [Alphaproteobacteria bacterium]MBV9153975.1 GAF domain-containing protein [Alphaproteobacteria bacterium]
MSGAEETSPSPAEWAGIGEAVPGAALPRRRLFRKYALIFIALVGAALLINSGLDFWFSYQENKAALVRVQQEKAEAAAQRIAEFVEEIKSQIGWTTHAQWAAGPLDQRRQDYVRLLRQVPAITELRQLDGDGKERLFSSRLAMDVSDSGADFSQSPAFIEAKAHKVWFSPVYFRKESEPYMTLAMALDGKNAGVAVADINLKLLFDVITALKIGQGGYAYVVDGRGRLIAHPDISLVLRDTDLSKLPQVAAALNPQSGEPAVMTAANIAGHSVLTAHAAIPQLGWRVFVEVPLAEAFAPLYGAALRSLALIALGLVAATLVALVIARRMIGPIRALQAGAAQIGAGDLSRRIDIHTDDELQGLAQQFNHMAADLQKSYAELEQRVRDRTAELSEALDQQTATAEVLGVINSSPGDLAPVFDAMLEKALTLCEASFGALATFDGVGFRMSVSRGYDPGPDRPARLAAPSPGTAFYRLIQGEECVHIEDITADEIYRSGDPGRRRLADQFGARTAVWVSLRKDQALLGAVVVYRKEVRPFSDKQIALLQNFAAQAVIAMENARLITETREALEQQTATAEVLGVINSSPGDLAPVFDAMLEKAMRLCEGSFGSFGSFDGEFLHAVAHRNVPAAVVEAMREPIAPTQGGHLIQIANGEAVVHIPDFADTEAYRAGKLWALALVDKGGAHTAVWVALRKDAALLGALVIYRTEIRPFTEKQIALLQNFAAQAVIAMENARL